MKKLISLDDGFFRELKQAFLPASLFQNDMQFIRSALAFALEQKKAGTPQARMSQDGTARQGTPQAGTPQAGRPGRARTHDLAQVSKQKANAHRTI